MKLHESPDRSIRPTKAVVRKSIFQRLEPWADKKVCDLYAGIGTLGIEALSRGAAHVTFVENDNHALSVLGLNLQKIKAGYQHSIARMDAISFLELSDEHFDVVLADPPYHSVTWEDLQLQVDGVLADEGVFVMELPRKVTLPENIDVRTFGKTKVGVWQKMT
ncbi:MAG: RsmD family RNA methyltransferase [Fidelibacterota bacterium]|nr:MAG: RsmD family RNA methyltransferase [Candidatus Neomarinimicrobiota bacterium]